MIIHEIKGKCKLFFKFRDEESKHVTEEERDLSWVDLFYLAADMFREKTRAMITRYPITGKDSNIFVKINLTVFTVDEGEIFTAEEALVLSESLRSKFAVEAGTSWK